MRSLITVTLLIASHAFVPSSWGARHASSLSVLTERQMQFWEDVETGLDDIEGFYKSNKGLDIDRVRQFAKR